jgi:hypothetical protein
MNKLTYAAAVVIATGLLRYDLQLIPANTSWIGNTWGGGNSWMQNYIEEMVVDANGRCRTNSGWDEGHNERGEYWFKNGEWHVTTHGIKDVPAVSGKTININGKTWTINNGFVGGPNGVGISDVQKATGLGIYRPKGYLMVCDDAPGQHVIKFFDVSTENPFLVKTFGEIGGIGGGIPGQVTPTKFWGLTGCGSDDAGNIYISISQEGVILRRYAAIDPQGLVWNEVPDEAIGLHFMDNAEIDRTTDGLDIWGKSEHYVMDYSQPAGKQAKLVGITLDTDRFPDDPRASNRGSIKVRYRDGKRFLFFFDQNAGALHVYRFDGELAVLFRSIKLANGRDIIINVDDDCNLWSLSGSAIEVMRCSGVESDGHLIYSEKAHFCSFPAPFTAVTQLLYDSARDVMFLGGGSAAKPTQGWGHTGPVIAKYRNWSTSRTLAWQTTVPFYHNEAPINERIVPMSWDYAGDRLYIGYLIRDQAVRLPPPYHDSPGVIRVYNTIDGAFVGRLLAGPEVHYGASWIDIFHGISAFERANGTHVICREEAWKAKLLLFTYTPTSGGVEPPRPSLHRPPPPHDPSAEVKRWSPLASSPAEATGPSNR